MIEVLPVRLLMDEDAPLFGSLNVSLGKLHRAGLAVGAGIVVTPPNLKLKATLEHYNFGAKEVFSETLVLVEKEIKKIPVSPVLHKEVGKHQQFIINGKQVHSIKNLWLALLGFWLNQIKTRLWNNGFYQGITEDLDPQVVTFVKKVKSLGKAFFDPFAEDVEIKISSGELHPNDKKQLVELIKEANKKLFIPYEYEWVLDGGIKLVKMLPYTPSNVILANIVSPESKQKGSWTSLQPVKRAQDDKKQSAVKVFFDLSTGLTIEKNVDGIYIASEKIFDLNKPRESFDNLASRLVESAITFPNQPILFKLADKSEGMGKVRGSLRLMHQKSLLTPLVEILDFARHKKGLINVHVVIPFVRNVGELLQIKRELATYKLMRKNSLKIWMEVAVPENIINLENYLAEGIDGIVLNLDELAAYLNGFDHLEEELMFYKNEVLGLTKFLEDSIKLLHKSKIPFLAYGSLSLYPKVLEFLVEKGVYGIVVEQYEAHSTHELLYQTEKRTILRRAQ